MEPTTGGKPAPGQQLLLLEPQYRERIWGGHRLRAADPPVGEAWLAFGGSLVAKGPFKGTTLDELVAAHGEAVLGAALLARYGTRFPLLIKLLDCAQWLSLQVHPDDEQARRMVGPSEFGKTEGWFFLETGPRARILLGTAPKTTAAALAAAIRAGRALDVAAQVEVHAGEAVLLPAGTLHALGPGLLLYEIEQASDTTFRAYDWGRPQTAGRQLHLEESAEVARPLTPRDRIIPAVGDATGSARALACDYFELELVSLAETPLPANTAGRTFHVLTLIEGTAELACGKQSLRLERYATALIPAAVGSYEARATSRPARLLRASVPD